MIHPAHVLAALCLSSAITLALVSVSVAQPPPTPGFTAVPVDVYGKTPQHVCVSTDPHHRGVAAVVALVMAAYPGSTSGETWSPCGSSGHSTLSLHHSGQAWDWFVASPGAAAGLTERAMGDELVGWLLQTVGSQPHMRARRLGITEIIWFDRLWTSAGRQWMPYTVSGCPAADNTTCHRDHVHLTFSREGAGANTSWWLGLQGWLLSTLGYLLT